MTLKLSQELNGFLVHFTCVFNFKLHPFSTFWATIGFETLKIKNIVFLDCLIVIYFSLVWI